MRSRKKFKISARSECIEKNPTIQTTWFGHQFINLSAIARECDVSVAMVSKIFKGVRNPSLDTADKIAEALGVRIGPFLEALKWRKDILACAGEYSKPLDVINTDEEVIYEARIRH